MAEEEATHVGRYVVDRDDREGKDGPCLGWKGVNLRRNSSSRTCDRVLLVELVELLDAFQAGLGRTHHAMSEGEIAEGSLTTEEEDGSVSPTKQGVP